MERLCRTDFFLLLLVSVLTALPCRADWGLPNPPSTALGEAGTLYLADPGWFIDVHNNDWIGQTDKLLTYSTAIAYFQALQTKKNPGDPTPEAIKLGLNSRLLTPIIKTRFDEKELPQHVGVFAEWLELELAYSRLIGRFKLELAIAGDFFGNFHTDEGYRFFHQVVASPDGWDKFGTRYEGTFGAATFGFGYVWSEHVLSMLYYNKNQIMEDEVIATSLILPLSDTLHFAAENRFAYQMASEIYAHPRRYRHEWTVGLKWHFWQANFKYISPYLEEDRWGQYFLSPLILNW